MVRRFYRANGAVIRGGGGLPWNYTPSALILVRQSFIGRARPARRGRGAQEVLAHTAAALHCQRTRQVDWHGSLRRFTFSWPSTSGTETRGATDSGAVREAVRENEQERLHRCRGDRGGCLTTDDAFRAGQD